MTNDNLAGVTEPITDSTTPENHQINKCTSDVFPINLPDDFVPLEVLGKGGMGYVLRARQISLDREVAIKVISPAIIGNSSSTVNFLNEAKLCAKLRHPNIVQVFQVGETDSGSLFIVMELLGGQSLLQFVEKIIFPRKFSLSFWKKHQTLIFPILFGLCDALSAAHECRIVHRDIKPANIQLDEDGRVRLIDFGIALLKSKDEQIVNTSIAGTLSWMAPEQLFDSEKVDHRSDIFALGGILLYMLTGSSPRNIKSVEEFVRISVNEKGTTAFPKNLPFGLPKELVKILDKALAINPLERYDSVSEFRKNLESVYLESIKPKQKFVFVKKYAKSASVVFSFLCILVIFAVFYITSIRSIESEALAMLKQERIQIEAYLVNGKTDSSSAILLHEWDREIDYYISNHEISKAIEIANFATEYMEWDYLIIQAEYLNQENFNSSTQQGSNDTVTEHFEQVYSAFKNEKTSTKLAQLKADSMVLYRELIK